MAFPAQYFYSILEVAGRWGCTQTEVINFAMSDEINLVAGFQAVKFGTECAAGLMHVAGTEVRALFRPYGKGAKKIYVTQARQSASDVWTTITEPFWKGMGLAWFARGIALVLGLFCKLGLNVLDFRLRLGDGGLLIFEGQFQLIRGQLFRLGPKLRAPVVAHLGF